MPSLKEVRNRIVSIKSTQQITSAMKMVAASKLRKAQNNILAMRPYASKLRELLQDLSGSIDNIENNVYTDEREPQKVLLIAISSNKGLCGAFNANVIKRVKLLISKEYAQQHKAGNLDLFFFGKKAYEHLKRGNINSWMVILNCWMNSSSTKRFPLPRNS